MALIAFQPARPSVWAVFAGKDGDGYPSGGPGPCRAGPCGNRPWARRRRTWGCCRPRPYCGAAASPRPAPASPRPPAPDTRSAWKRRRGLWAKSVAVQASLYKSLHNIYHKHACIAQLMVYTPWRTSRQCRHETPGREPEEGRAAWNQPRRESTGGQRRGSIAMFDHDSNRSSKAGRLLRAAMPMSSPDRGM